MTAGVAISPIPELLDELAAGRMIVLLDEEDRENEGDLLMAADKVTPEAINFMARYGRGLICLTLTREHCQRLKLPPMAAQNGTVYATAFTVSIEAARGVTTGISAADRAHTIATAVAPDARAEDLVQPGHVFPLQAQDGGVLVRAGHTEAGCDMTRMAGCSPTAVICEIMNDDGSMARLPDLQQFAATHGLKLGTIADLIAYRSRAETLITPLEARPMVTPWGEFTAQGFRDSTGGVHLALSVGTWAEDDEVWVRVHEPLNALDLLDDASCSHSWPLGVALRTLRERGRGLAVLLNAAGHRESLLRRLDPTGSPPAPQRDGLAELRLYGIGAQIIKAHGVRRMKLMAHPARLPSMRGFDLEVTGFASPDLPPIHISEPTRPHWDSYAVVFWKKKTNK
ncbi:bifunctional 3,4-dihydroxy-2-butanone-4-phosphate synthase/GTP cyclohydrolase II [Amphibiibacter pelophylacis]|uniref:Bifunctional 3,4-dihydroxy-2-butanone-4-phosphate synthase/GTP cyclohydrolase II n=1 Tax=Amphibiibacter pelophylacis TaxID=1799477 RepID=A0ACC6P5A8_9BURK